MVQFQVAKFVDLKEIKQREAIISCGSNSKGYGIIYVSGQRQPEDKEEYEKFL